MIFLQRIHFPPPRNNPNEPIMQPIKTIRQCNSIDEAHDIMLKSLKEECDRLNKQRAINNLLRPFMNAPTDGFHWDENYTDVTHGEAVVYDGVIRLYHGDDFQIVTAFKIHENLSDDEAINLIHEPAGRLLVFVKSEFVRDSQVLIKTPVTDENKNDDANWCDLSGDMLLMDIETTNVQKDIRNIPKKFPGIDLTVLWGLHLINGRVNTITFTHESNKPT